LISLFVKLNYEDPKNKNTNKRLVVYIRNFIIIIIKNNANFEQLRKDQTLILVWTIFNIKKD